MKWQIGEVTITAIVESSSTHSLHDLFPAARDEEIAHIDWIGPPYLSAEGRVVLAIQAFCVETPDKRIIVDTCNGNDKSRATDFGHMQQSDLLDRMTLVGFGPEDVDIVLCTHLHADHVGWNTSLRDGRWVPTFPRARYLIGRIEFEHEKTFAGTPFHEQFDDSVRPIVEAGLVDLVETDHQICRELRLIASPGHTPGHVSVMIESGGELALITGDFLHTPLQIARPDWSLSFDHDPELARSTRTLMLNTLADTSTLILGSHFPSPTAGHVVREGASLRFCSHPQP